jgi:hypothetical protein
MAEQVYLALSLDAFPSLKLILGTASRHGMLVAE